MGKSGSTIRKGEENPDPEWEERRRSMTRIERAGYVSLAVFFFIFGINFFWLNQTHTDDGALIGPLTVVGVLFLIGCGYFTRKAWLGKRKLPEE